MVTSESGYPEGENESPHSASSARARSAVSTLWQRVASVNSTRAFALTVVVILVALTLVVPIRTYLSQRSEMSRLQAQNVELSKEIADYQRKVTEQNDPAWIEAQARERLQYAMPGEKTVVLTYPSREKQKAEEKKAREYAANPWYQNLWDSLSTPPEDK